MAVVGASMTVVSLVTLLLGFLLGLLVMYWCWTRKNKNKTAKNSNDPQEANAVPHGGLEQEVVVSHESEGIELQTNEAYSYILTEADRSLQSLNLQHTNH